MEAELLKDSCQEVRPNVSVKLRQEAGDAFVMARSGDRQGKEQAIRRRKMKNYRDQLKQLSEMDLKRDDLLKKLRIRVKNQAPALTPRRILENLTTIRMVDVDLPTTDNGTVILRRHTVPEPDVTIIPARMRLELHEQPTPRINAAQVTHPAVMKTFTRCFPIAQTLAQRCALQSANQG